MAKYYLILIFLVASCSLEGKAQAQENAVPDRGTCPTILVNGPGGVFAPTEPAIFEAVISNKSAAGLKYIWTTTIGKITSGQGTSKIELVPPEGVNGGNVTVTVNIEGLPIGCPSSASETSPMMSVIEGDPVDEYGGISRNDETARFDNFFFQLKSNPSYDGLVVIGFTEKDNRQRKINSLRQIIDLLNFRRYNINKLSFAIGEGASEQQTSLWLVFPGGKLPKVADKYILIDGKDLAQKIPTLFKKK